MTVAVSGGLEARKLLRLSHDLTLAIADAETSPDALAAILCLFCEAGDWVLGQVWLPDERTAELKCSSVWYARMAGYEQFRAASLSTTFALGAPLLGTVWRDRQVHWAEDIGGDTEGYRRASVAADLGLNTGLVVPVVVDDDVIAVLEFLTAEHRTADPQLQELVASAAAQVGSLIAKRQAEIDLKSSEAQFRAVADTANDAIVSIDSDGIIRYANRYAAVLFELELDTLIGAAVTTIIPERLHAAHGKGFSRFLATGEPHLIGRTVTVPARRADDSEIPVELSLAAWSVGQSTQFTAILRDISERQRVQTELEEALAQEQQTASRLHELDALKNTFLDTVSHDLRAPLAAIAAVTELLSRDVDRDVLTPHQRQTSVDGLAASVRKMRRLLDDLLDLEQIASGNVRLERRSADLADIVKAAVDEHGAALDGRQLQLDLERLEAYVDPPKVERIIENLLLNAARHTPPGTSVRVSLRRAEGFALLCVEDAGPGVPAELREVVFERFSRVPGGSVEGRGVGLSLVARLARLHGGRAWVDDRPGGGASFRVELPLGAAAAQPGGAT